MTRDQVELVRAKSKQRNGPTWTQNWAQMARKSAVRRLQNYVPLTARAIEAIARDDEREFGNLAESPAASRTAEVRERIRANSGKRRQPPKSGQGAPEAEEVAPVGAPDDSAGQRTNEGHTAKSGEISRDFAVEGEAREVCGATSDPKLGEVETCVLDAGHLTVERAPQSHQSAGGSVWPAVSAKRSE